MSRIVLGVGLGFGAMSLGLLVSHAYGDSVRHPVRVGLASLSIASPAALGLGGVKTHLEESDIEDLHRKRLARNQSLPVEVKNVNYACDQYGIPLTEELADLFLLHHAVSPVEGSPCDASFEFMLKTTFDKECSSGLSREYVSAAGADILIKQGHGDLLIDERDKEIKAFNKAGYIAHSFYQTAKKFKFSLLAYGLSPVHKERYSRSDNLICIREEIFSKESAIYISSIEAALENIKSQLEAERKAQDWEPYCREENDFRDDLVFIEGEKIKLIQSQFSKTIQQEYKAMMRAERESTDNTVERDDVPNNSKR